MPFRKQITEELLESLYLAEEDSATLDLDTLCGLARVDKAEFFAQQLLEQGLIEEKGTAIHLTDKGREIGRTVVRSHRLAERLFHDVLGMEEGAEDAACRFEHAIDETVAEHICTLLGHPAVCPHGKPIPPGECCRRHEQYVPRAIVPLSELRLGQSGIVAYIAAPDHAQIDRLAALGLVPGRSVTVMHDSPGVVLSFGATQLALDRETVAQIYVKVKGPAKNGVEQKEGPGAHMRRRRGWRFGHGQD